MIIGGFDCSGNKDAAGEMAEAGKNMLLDMADMPALVKDYMRAYIKDMGLQVNTKKENNNAD